MTEVRTEAQAIEERLLEALTTIRACWGAMLPKAAPVQRIGGGSRSTRITLADDDSRGGDIDPTTRLVSLRREAMDLLNSWSRVVMEDRPVERALPDGRDVLAMVAFLETHARWMSGHEAGRDCADEVTVLARTIRAVVLPPRRDTMLLGACPLEVLDEETGVMARCTGKVRYREDHRDAAGEAMPTCSGCGVEAVVAWWEERMFDDVELRVSLTDEEVVAFIHRAFGQVIQQATVRQWVRRGWLVPSGERDGRRTFDRAAVVFALDRKQRVGS